jgi:hypothetical protein
LIVGMVGIVSLIFFFQFIHLAHGLKPGEDAIEPMALIAAPFALNIADTAGWAGELHLRLLWRIRSPAIGPALLILGLSFSLLLVPATLCFVVCNLDLPKSLENCPNFDDKS